MSVSKDARAGRNRKDEIIPRTAPAQGGYTMEGAHHLPQACPAHPGYNLKRYSYIRSARLTSCDEGLAGDGPCD